MASKRTGNRRTGQGQGGTRGKAKVGSNPDAAEQFADQNDFGIPADQARDKAAAGQDMANRRDHQRIARGGKSGLRESGAGREDSGPGSSSGGDVDATYTAVTGGGISQSPADSITIGPASSTGTSDEFASGGHAKGEGNLPPDARGSTPPIKGTTHNAGEPGTSAGGGGSGGHAGDQAVGKTDRGVVDPLSGGPGSDDVPGVQSVNRPSKPSKAAPRGRKREEPQHRGATSDRGRPGG